ncbi:MAG: hypothetical protein ABIJ08_00960, partial [Nanoarchaeota archaeon]
TQCLCFDGSVASGNGFVDVYSQISGSLEGDGTCGGSTCADGQICCTGECKDRDNTHCTACNIGCTGTTSCQDVSGTYQCIDLQTDINNCGTSGHACGANEACCSGTCTSITTKTNCGACANICGANQDCCSKICQAINTATRCGSCSNSCSGTTPTCCSGTCVNTNTNADHCGSCGNDCGTDTCTSGTCNSGGGYVDTW